MEKRERERPRRGKSERYRQIRLTSRLGVDGAMTEQCIIAASFHYFEPLSDSFSIKSNGGDGVEWPSITLIGAKIKGLGMK